MKRNKDGVDKNGIYKNLRVVAFSSVTYFVRCTSNRELFEAYFYAIFLQAYYIVYLQAVKRF